VRGQADGPSSSKTASATEVCGESLPTPSARVGRSGPLKHAVLASITSGAALFSGHSNS
jgi:hypothetical protein